MKFVLLWAALALAVPAQDSRGLVVDRAPQRKALVLGNKAYLKDRLSNTLNDATDMAAALRGYGFTVDLATDVSKAEMQNQTAKFVQKLAPGDVAWFYYSGHGFQLDGENYLVPVDFSAAGPAEARSKAVAFSHIKSSLEKSPAQLSIMVLDACRNNPFSRETFGLNGMALLEAGMGAYIAFAAAPGQTATENAKERNGLYTGYLLQALRQPLSISDLFRRVRQDVYRASERKQLPYIHDQVIAEFFLREPAKTAPAPESRPGSKSAPQDRAPVEALFEEGKSLYHAGHCKEALEKLDQVVRRDPANPYVQNGIGLSYVCLSMATPAIEHFSRAIELKPAYAAAYWNRGQVFLRNAQYELAIEDFDWALEQEPENAALYWRRGVARFGLRRYEDAQKDFTASIARDATNPNGYHGRGRVYYELGKYREALADFDAAIARKHDFADAVDYRNRVLQRLNGAR
jgi:uncharacterized caspase-like protein